MALEPPHTGPQELPQEDLAATPSLLRRQVINQHLHIINDIASRLVEITAMGPIAGRDAVEMTNVDGMPSMSETEFLELRDALTEAITKTMDLHDHMQAFIVMLRRVARR